MSSPSEVAAGRESCPVVPTGNTFDKYGSQNPVVRRLMAGFERTLEELFSEATPGSVLDVGCGEGVLTERWAQRLPSGRVVGVDLEDPKLRSQWSTRDRANLEFRTTEGGRRLEFDTDEFDLVAAIEALETIPE